MRKICVQQVRSLSLSIPENITSNWQFQQASRSLWLSGCNYNLSLQSGKRSCVSVMEFEWDEVKRLTNLRKHGIDFIDIPAVFDGDTVRQSQSWRFPSVANCRT
ncbi:MAG: hypothetical protein V7L20_02395 [Nostoc sp.]|uniref:hypothetical protein n=1 Tax=Nostoc sp. TaxID=1180 RepID=UPI002FF516FD